MNTLDLTNLSQEQVVRLNEISNVVKADFNELIGEIYHDTDLSIDWLVSSSLSRNNYLCPVFQQICLLLLVKDILPAEPDLQIEVADAVLGRVLSDYLQHNQIRAVVVTRAVPETPKQKIKRRFRAWFDWYHNARFFFEMWRTRSTARKQAIPKNRELTLIDTFFLPTILEQNEFRDRYYPGLLENLTEGKQQEVYFSPTFLVYHSLARVLEIAAAAKDKFIFRNDFLKMSDYVFALTRAFRIKRIDFEKYTFHGFRIGPLLAADFRHNLNNTSTLSGLLNYRFFKRLQEAGVKLRLVADWFENQVIDRGWNKGVRDFYAEALRVGYQGYVISTDFNFYVMPTDYEIQNGVIPDEIAVVGSGLVETIRKGSGEIKVKPAPAFRFGGVWQALKPTSPRTEKIVLIALPIDFGQSCEIVGLTLAAIKTGGLDDITFHLKPHPSLDFQTLQARFRKDWPAQFKTVDGDFATSLQNVGVMIGNTSSTCLEAVCLGVPVVVVGSQSGLTQNPIPASVTTEMWRLVYSSNALAKAVNDFITRRKSDPAVFTDLACALREHFFMPVTRSGVIDFLHLPQDDQIIAIRFANPEVETRQQVASVNK